MDDYSYLRIDGVTLIETKPCENEILFLFLSSELDTEEEVDENEFETRFIYTQTAKVIKERLEVKCITLERAKEVFNILKLEEIEHLKSFSTLSDSAFFLYESKVNLLEQSSYEDFLVAIQYIINNKQDLLKNTSIPPIVNYLLFGAITPKYNAANLNINFEEVFSNLPLSHIDNDITDSEYIFHFLLYLRIIIELVPAESMITYDFTEVFREHELENNDDKDYLYSFLLNGLYPSIETIENRIIVLTEGSTDTEFLKDSIDILFPYMKYHYRFVNYDGKVSGGADALMKTVRTFAGLNRQDKIIALFDNDTAGLDAVRVLSKDNIDYEEKSIKILHYPALFIADNYPCVDRNGIVTEENINGRACSIEMYLGRDVLTNKTTGQLIPIKWGKEVPSLNQLQGEISDKKNIQKRFRQKLKVCKQDSSLIEKYDWDGVKSILKMIFSTFNE